MEDIEFLPERSDVPSPTNRFDCDAVAYCVVAGSPALRITLATKPGYVQEVFAISDCFC